MGPVDDNQSDGGEELRTYGSEFGGASPAAPATAAASAAADAAQPEKKVRPLHQVSWIRSACGLQEHAAAGAGPPAA